jgi:prolyl oligopeptidase
VNISNEVDRYIGWPGQALAYKVGQLEMLHLREDARRALGEAFDIRSFHDALLSGGALGLDAVREIVRRRLGFGAG